MKAIFAAFESNEGNCCKHTFVSSVYTIPQASTVFFLFRSKAVLNNENVYLFIQEPFLCNSCGFCKYARLESTLFARPVPSVQPIENDEDRIAVRFLSILNTSFPLLIQPSFYWKKLRSSAKKFSFKFVLKNLFPVEVEGCVEMSTEIGCSGDRLVVTSEHTSVISFKFNVLKSIAQ